MNSEMAYFEQSSCYFRVAVFSSVFETLHSKLKYIINNIYGYITKYKIFKIH